MKQFKTYIKVKWWVISDLMNTILFLNNIPSWCQALQMYQMYSKWGQLLTNIRQKSDLTDTNKVLSLFWTIILYIILSKQKCDGCYIDSIKTKMILSLLSQRVSFRVRSHVCIFSDMTWIGTGECLKSASCAYKLLTLVPYWFSICFDLIQTAHGTNILRNLYSSCISEHGKIRINTI